MSEEIKKLLGLDVGKHVESKPSSNGKSLSYLSWAWAWDQALRADPNATFHVESWTDDQGQTKCWMDVNGTAMVWVRVNMLGQTRTCMLPVMNARNEPISISGRQFKDRYGNEKVEKLDAFNLNTAIMRCLTKCLALFGLGLYIYAGEDLPMDDEPEAKKKPEDMPPKAEPVPKEAVQAPKETVQDPEETVQEEEDPNLALFAQAVIEYIDICKDMKGLKSYYKSNQIKLDELQKKMPSTYQKVREVLNAKKAQLQGVTNE